MSINSVVLDEGRVPLPINSLEKVKLEFKNVTLKVQTGLGYPGSSNNYYGSGNLFCTNYRLMFVSEPKLLLFDTFMITWNKIDEGNLEGGSWWNLWTRKPPVYQSIVYPIITTTSEESSSSSPLQLSTPAQLTLTFKSLKDAEILAECVKNSRWTGQLDPENTAEPPPPYSISVNVEGTRAGGRAVGDSLSLAPPSPPPPTYENVIGGEQT